METIFPCPIEGADFHLFGELVDVQCVSGQGTKVNQGRGEKFECQFNLDHFETESDPCISMYKVMPSSLPVIINLLERHPHSSQVFIPVRSERYLVVVAPSNSVGLPDMDQVRAFIAPACTGVHYFPQTWHLPLMPLDEEGLFTMIMWKQQTDADCVECRLSAPFQVSSVIRQQDTVLS
ncbi:ureidoglycolate lyase [Aestuariirhabdus litorea]|uniref:Ureidoglycolate hydrolase n=1 Tax=Aestuariirhabdus litorea TaxID=2528527 RepID=A0A3P3VHS4_9GAMM|nr:ureidoglycolate lyase [Aestuariirhabdus litorea]RRJ82271.1 hypothetical protein D0544_10305 [Aestuariirhabdus litorea]RWW92437.1 hypothetical protein DZC74_10285 [Endozoicomonadaceae bacterium GTF-13]